MAEAQLHELLAAETDLRGQAGKILLETKQNFAKSELFSGLIQTCIPFSDADASIATEGSRAEVVTTVPKRLQYTADKLVEYYDAVYQKEATNQLAKSDIVVDGQVLARDVPATVLLGLETKLTEFRSAIDGMPTLDAKRAWKPDSQGRAGIWENEHDEEKLRTKKVTKDIVVIPPTEKHPGQARQAVEDVAIGKWVTKSFSGAVTSARAAKILSRLDTLIRAVKAARQRANTQPIVKGNIGKSLFDYILAE